MESTAEFETALSEWKCADAVVSVWRCAVAGAAESSAPAPEGRALAVLCDLTRDVLRFFADGAASLLEHRRTASDDDSGCPETAAAASEVAADTARAAVRLLNGELARHALIEAEKTLRGELALHVPSVHVRTFLQLRCGGGAVWAEDAATIVAAAVEYILSEVCELSSTSAAVKKEDEEPAETPLSPRKIFLAIAGDEELAMLFRNSAIAGSGVFPNIHPCYMPRVRCVGDDEEAKEDPEDEEAIAEMREVQATGNLLIEEAGFREFANGVAAYVPEMKGHDLGDDALQVLQAAAEDFLQTRFRHTSLAAIHARRTVSNPEDMQLVQRLVEEREEEDDDEAMEDGSATCVPRAAFAALAEELVEAEWAVRTKASLPPTTSEEPASATAAAAATEEPLITDEAIAVLHKAAEAEMAEMMRSSLAIAEHGGRMSVFPKDTMLWRRITGACRHIW